MLKNRLNFSLGIGVAVVAGQRLWQAVAGALTTFLLSTRLDPVDQGWYYTFVSIAALYTVFEMGLSTVVLQVAAHKFVDLDWSEFGVEGKDASGFGSFFSKSVKAYLIAAIIFLLTVYPIGALLFGERAQSLSYSLNWASPWMALVVLTSMSILALPFLAVVEGSGAIAEVYAVRLAQGILGSLGCWLLLWLDEALWATMMMGLAVVCVLVIWLKVYRDNLLSLLARNWFNDEFDWKNEILPLQWRVALGYLSVFAGSQLATPIVFFYQGPISAGQLGLSLALAQMVGMFAQSWITRSVPSMSQAVAKNDWAELRRIFAYDFKRALVVFFGGAAFVFGMWFALLNTSYIQRVVSGDSLFSLFLFVLVSLINGSFAVQLRSFKKEPLLWVFCFGGILSLLGTWGAAQHSVDAVAYILLAVQLIVVFPLAYRTWKIKNEAWQLEPQVW